MRQRDVRVACPQIGPFHVLDEYHFAKGGRGTAGSLPNRNRYGAYGFNVGGRQARRRPRLQHGPGRVHDQECAIQTLAPGFHILGESVEQLVERRRGTQQSQQSDHGIARQAR